MSGAIGTLPIKWLNDEDGDRFFPVTNIKSVRDDNGVGLDVIIGSISDIEVNDGLLTVQRNGATIGTFGANEASNKTINITVPTSAADVNALPSSTKYASSLSVTIGTSDYVMTVQLKNQDGGNLGTAQTIDLPLETMVVGGSYDSGTKKVVLTLKNGQTVDFSVADLISGLQSEITTSNKLSADLVSDGTTNKVYTATEQTKLSGIAAGAEVNVQADWTVTDTASDAYIKNKPDIPVITIKEWTEQ